MLSTSVIKNVSDAGHYYAARDNYYTKEEGISQSEWFGKGAEKLSLQGEVSSNHFTSLLEGKLPNGEQVGKMVDGKVKHRAGWDLTFSAPKSVSILALVGGDSRLIDAHRKAVKASLSEIERSCSEVRMKVRSETNYHNTQNMVTALYHHDLSRARDPQLHTHSVILNMTQRSDGKWRSQASKLGRYDKETDSMVHGFIERVRHHKRYYGKLYEAELAFQVKALGYEIEINRKTGVFEIVGVPVEVNQHFSKRRNQIEQQLSKSGFLSGGRAADIATMKTRDNKKWVDRENLQEQWREEAKKLGLDYSSLIEKSYFNKFSPSHAMTGISLEENAITAIKEASKALSTFKTVFSLEEIITIATENAIKNKIDVNHLLQTMQHLINTDNFLKIENELGKTFLMDKSVLEEEKQISQYLNDTKDFHQKVSADHLEQYLIQHDEMVPAVKEAISEIFSNHQYILIEGERGRNALIKPIVDVAKSNGLDIVIVGSSQIIGKKSAESLKKNPDSIWDQIKAWFVDPNIKNQSVTQFLSADLKHLPDIVLVEKSHLLSTSQLANLLVWGKNHEKQIIFIANKNLLQSQQRSVGINYLIEQGINTITLPEINKSIYALVNNNDLQGLIHHVSENLLELQHPEDRLQAMAKHFCHLENRNHAFLIGNSKRIVERLNYLTHNELKESGKLGIGFPVKVLLPHFLSEIATKNAASFCKNDWVRFNAADKKSGISQGDYLKIKSHNKETNEVLLINSKNKVISWYPAKEVNVHKIEYFKERERELCVGERIKFHRSLKTANVVKGEYFTIQAVTKNRVKLIRESGRAVVLDLNKAYHRHIDYGYANTPHQLVQEKPLQLIAELPCQSFHTDKRKFFQIVSQSKDVCIYTDNKVALLVTLERKSGSQLTAAETLKKSDQLKNTFHSIFNVLERTIQSKAKEANPIQLSKAAIDAIDYAIKHLAEREAGFTHKELMSTAIQYALGDVSPQVISDSISAMEKANILLKGERYDGPLWTTWDAVNIERQIISLCSQDKGKFQPIVHNDIVEKFCNSKTLHSEQIAAIKAIAQSKDRVLAIQGKAGTGKTTLMTTLADIVAAKEMLNIQGYELRGLAPTHSAVKELTSRGIKAQTLDSFLLEMQKGVTHSLIKPDLSKSIIIIDEASMVSNRKMLEMLKLGTTLNVRMMITVGDTRQLSSIEAGKPQALIQTQIQPLSLENIRRQENAVLKKAVQETYDYRFTEALKTLKESIIEIDDNTAKGNKSQQENQSLNRLARIKALVADYISIDPQQRSTTLVITPGHEDRVLTNALIREQLKQEGTLGGNEYSFQVLSSHSMTKVEKSHIKHFEVGQILRFNVGGGQYKAGDYLTVIKVLDQHRMLVLRNQQGKEILWQVPNSKTRLNNAIEVFKQEERQLQVGDSIRWSRTDKLNDLFSSDIARVTEVQKNNITLKFAGQKQLSFNPNNPTFQHWDHAYALTVYTAQGSTKQTVLALLESYRENLVNQPAFLVALTRAVDKFRIYTDNTQALLTRIKQNSGVKHSSLEVIGAYPNSLQNAPKKKESALINAANRINFDRYTSQQIAESLNKDAEKIAINILGKPVLKTSQYLQFGSNKGSLRVTIHGSKKGLWNDFSGGVTNQGKTGGNMLQFLQVFGGMTRKEALEYGAKQYGYDIHASPTISNKALLDLQKQAHKKREEQLKAESIGQQKKIRFAKRLAEQSQPIKGTLAERYLKEHRDIVMEKYPDDVRYHPSIYSKINGQTLPAMLVIARDGKGEIKAVQATYLNPQTGAKVNKLQIKIQKQTFGVLAGAAVFIAGKDTKNTLIAEGAETGLSLAKAIPDANVKIVLGKSNLLHIDLTSSTRNITLCLDNDGKNIREDKIIFEAAKRLVDSGKSIRLAIPIEFQNDKQDYNDLLKKSGPDSVRQSIKEALSFERFNQLQVINQLSNQTELDQNITRYVSETTRAFHKNEREFTNIKRDIQSLTIEKPITRESSFDREI